jgi:hypothetical protein
MEVTDRKGVVLMETQCREYGKTCPAPALGCLGVGATPKAYADDPHMPARLDDFVDEIAELLRAVRFRLGTAVVHFRGERVLQI